MTRLSVNVNKLATLRNARGKNNPDVLKTTLDIIKYGAEGITVHPRPDERHIRKSDVYQIAEAIDVEFNIEGYPDRAFLKLVRDVKPTQCTLVPDPPHVLTSNAGWKIEQNISLLQEIIANIKEAGIRVAIFIDPNEMSAQDLALLKSTGTDRVELYTEAYAVDFETPKAAQTLSIYQDVALAILEMGIELNAGHDLDLHNLRHFVSAIPQIKEVSIGHALICDALQLGLEGTIARYLQCLRGV